MKVMVDTTIGAVKMERNNSETQRYKTKEYQTIIFKLKKYVIIRGRPIGVSAKKAVPA